MGLNTDWYCDGAYYFIDTLEAFAEEQAAVLREYNIDVRPWYKRLTKLPPPKLPLLNPRLLLISWQDRKRFE